MNKTLLVTYLPSQHISKTKQVVDTFTEAVGKKTQLTHHDLLKTPASLHDPASIASYYKRNFGGQKLTLEEERAIGRQDEKLKEFLQADTIVMAYPVHNFSFPASVKAYFDSVIQKGVTHDYVPQRVGLLTNKRGLLISTSAGIYTEENGNADWDHFTTLGRQLLEFMGFKEIEVINAGGMGSDEEFNQAQIGFAQEAIKKVVQRWY